MRIVVETPNDLVDLWFHLLEDHGLSKTSLHGNPFNMHDAAFKFGLCDREYVSGPGGGEQ